MNISMKSNPMNKLQVLSVAVALALTSAAAFAQAQQAAHQNATARVQLDLNHDGVIDRAEAAKAPRLAVRFDQMDVNKDGKLSADERPHAGGKHRRGAMRGGHGRMMEADTDKDGRISRAEMQAAQVRMAEHFDQMDVNKDGYLDRADMQARMTQQRTEFFKGADVDHDGRVTRNEFIVEQGARSVPRREHWGQRAQVAGKQVPARQQPTAQQRIEFAGKAFDRMDANKDGALTRAELDAFKPNGHGMHHGKNQDMDHDMDDAMVPAPKQ
ncbi:MAG: EF-hand domain-containing protein [Thermomonas sp.]